MSNENDCLIENSKHAPDFSSKLVITALYQCTGTLLTADVGNVRDLYAQLDYSENVIPSFTTDWDKSLTMCPIYVTAEGDLNVQKYYENPEDAMTLRNIDELILKSFIHPVHICTGKGWNIGPLAAYIRNRTEELAVMLDIHERMENGVLRSLAHPEMPVTIFISPDNGGFSVELMSLTPLVYKPIPLQAWEQMVVCAELLDRSTTLERKRTIAKRVHSHTIYEATADPFALAEYPYETNVIHNIDKKPITNDNLFREIAPLWTKDESNHLHRIQEALGHIGVFSTLGTKINFVLDVEKIIHDNSAGGLRESWKSATGIDIIDLESFKLAVGILTKDWHATVRFNEAHGILFLDVMAPDVHKGHSARWMKKFVQYNIEQAYRKISKKIKVLTFTMADGVFEGSTDKPIIDRTRSVVVRDADKDRPERTIKGYPIYLCDIYRTSPMKQTYSYLRESTLLSCPPEHRKSMTNVMHELDVYHTNNIQRAQ
jgi:hypothetical protein